MNQNHRSSFTDPSLTLSEVDRWLIRGATTILARRSRALPFLGGGLLCGLGGRRATFFLAHSCADSGCLRLGRRERGRVERGSLRAESLLLQGSVGEDAGVELPTDGCVHGYTVARLYAFHEHPGQRGAGSTPQ